MGLIGPNGSGKSALLRSIFGLADVFSGSITVDGVPITGLTGAETVSLGAACVPQRNNVFDALNVGKTCNWQHVNWTAGRRPMPLKPPATCSRWLRNGAISLPVY